MAFGNGLGRLVGVSLLALVTSAAAADAATLVGLTADNKLVKIDTASLAARAPSRWSVSMSAPPTASCGA
jgi:hypothetical protein